MKIISVAILAFLLMNGFELLSQTNRQYETNPDKKRANIWYFGQNAGISFNTNPPTPLTDGKINTWEGCSSICDTSGNLLFYTDGRSVWDNNHQIMVNGTGLNGDISSTQSALIIHHPENDSIYFIITTPYAYDYNVGARYSIVNLNQKKIIAKNLVLHPNSSEKITAVYHGNGKDIWVVGHEYGNRKFFSYLLTENNFINCGIISNVGGSLDSDEFNNQGQIKFSVDGKLIAICHFTDMLVDLFDFDNFNGILTLKNSIYTNGFVSGILPYSIDFSYDGSFLYIFLRDSHLLQYDIKNNKAKSLKKLTSGQWGQCSKSPLGKILFQMRDSSVLGSISNDNDSNALIINHLISISPKKTISSLPNFNQSYFYTPSIDFAYRYDCIKNSISFEGRDTFYADSFVWKLKKVYGSTLFSSNLKLTTLNFTDTGVYQVMYIATKGVRSDTAVKNITIYPKIDKNILGRDSMYKSDVLFNLVLKTPLNMHCISWHDSSSSPTFTADTTGVFSVTVTNKAFCTVSDTITITRCVNSLQKPTIYRNSDTLFTNLLMVDSFIWFRNKKQVVITKDTFILLTDTGSFQVEAAKLGYCSNVSDILNYNCLFGLSIPRIYMVKDTLYTYQPFADSFQWYKNGQAFRITKDSFIIIADTGLFMVKALKTKYCGSISNQISVKCIDNLIQPVLYQNKDTLFSSQSMADSFMWYRNGLKIKVTSKPFIIIVDTGTYRLEIKKNNSCIESSKGLNVSKLDVGLLQLTNYKIKIYPNPASQTVNIETNGYPNLKIRIYDCEGKLIYESMEKDGKSTLDTGSLAKGLYLIELINYQLTYHYKIIIQ